MRVGVNTGEVVVRTLQTDATHTEYTPIGHSTSLAARLQTLAAPGSIAISDTVRKFVEGYFTLKALGPARIKGVSEPVPVFEVTGLGPLRTRLQRAVGRGLTKFVGRQRELEALRQAAEQAKAGHGQLVAVVGEAGVGKSRLFYEFKASAQAGCLVLETVSVSHGKASAYLPVIESVARLLPTSPLRTTRAPGARRSRARCWRWTARWKIRCRTCSGCWVWARARTRSPRWTRSCGAGARWRPSSGWCCANR